MNQRSSAWSKIRAFFRFKVSRRHILFEVGHDVTPLTPEEKIAREKSDLSRRAMDAENRLHFLQANADIVFGRGGGKSSGDTH